MPLKRMVTSMVLIKGEEKEVRLNVPRVASALTIVARRSPPLGEEGCDICSPQRNLLFLAIEFMWIGASKRKESNYDEGNHHNDGNCGVVRRHRGGGNWLGWREIGLGPVVEMGLEVGLMQGGEVMVAVG
ncbi:hypothetical protein MA16_Dca007383 [Dendrobium catenatum]|uniref:Uncharacterized protein n=1 Tax=Dendrobium catenatum TaxID=906689 RepID=A0A2I0W8M9_9ASPA|nr:hypothetical protein MA16_Dca007383 [Dendrobium catenatum]